MRIEFPGQGTCIIQKLFLIPAIYGHQRYEL